MRIIKAMLGAALVFQNIFFPFSALGIQQRMAIFPQIVHKDKQKFAEIYSACEVQ
jgi:hypothetical protein